MVSADRTLCSPPSQTQSLAVISRCGVVTKHLLFFRFSQWKCRAYRHPAALWTAKGRQRTATVVGQADCRQVRGMRSAVGGLAVRVMVFRAWRRQKVRWTILLDDSFSSPTFCPRQCTSTQNPHRSPPEAETQHPHSLQLPHPTTVGCPSALPTCDPSAAGRLAHSFWRGNVESKTKQMNAFSASRKNGNYISCLGKRTWQSIYFFSDSLNDKCRAYRHPAALWTAKGRQRTATVVGQADWRQVRGRRSAVGGLAVRVMVFRAWRRQKVRWTILLDDSFSSPTFCPRQCTSTQNPHRSPPEAETQPPHSPMSLS